MKMKRLDIFLLLFSLILCFSAFETKAQKKLIKKTSVKKKLQKPPKIISGGILNAKALILTRPEYPKSAVQFRLKGIVSVEVLIDENGNIIKANAKSGHPVLIPNSEKAALTSKFAPVQLSSGEKVQVSGVITYHYLSDSINWLEIGYASESINHLREALPFNFETEKQMLREIDDFNFNQQTKIPQHIISSIEGKLVNDTKNLWLFAVGQNIIKLTNNHWKLEKAMYLEKLQHLLLSQPDNISPSLIEKIKGLVVAENSEQLNKKLVDIIERMSLIGN